MTGADESYYSLRTRNAIAIEDLVKVSTVNCLKVYGSSLTTFFTGFMSGEGKVFDECSASQLLTLPSKD